MHKKLILIDLDGVLNNYNGDFDSKYIPDIKNGCKDFLKNLAKNYEIKIFTSRNLLLTAKWLIKNNIDSYISDITNVKNPAYLYIDDRCICFDGSFDKLSETIKNFNVYWK